MKDPQLIFSQPTILDPISTYLPPPSPMSLMHLIWPARVVVTTLVLTLALVRNRE